MPMGRWAKTAGTIAAETIAAETIAAGTIADGRRQLLTLGALGSFGHKKEGEPHGHPL